MGVPSTLRMLQHWGCVFDIFYSAWSGMGEDPLWGSPCNNELLHWVINPLSLSLCVYLFLENKLLLFAGRSFFVIREGTNLHVQMVGCTALCAVMWSWSWEQSWMLWITWKGRIWAPWKINGIKWMHVAQIFRLHFKKTNAQLLAGIFLLIYNNVPEEMRSHSNIPWFIPAWLCCLPYSPRGGRQYSEMSA